jgi:hypothetical protein
MSQVFSAMSHEPEQGHGTPKSLNDNVQIIHQGVDPPTRGDKYLTYTYSGSPRHAQGHITVRHNGNGIVIKEPTDTSASHRASNRELSGSHSRKSLRNNSSINKHNKKIEERKAVGRTQTQRLSEIATTEQYNQ